MGSFCPITYTNITFMLQLHFKSVWNYNCYYYLQICGIFISWIAKEISKKSNDEISLNKFKKSRSERNSSL